MPERASRPQVGVCLWPHTGTPLVYVRSWSTGHRCSPDARFPALVAANHRDRGNLAAVVTGYLVIVMGRLVLGVIPSVNGNRFVISARSAFLSFWGFTVIHLCGGA